MLSSQALAFSVILLCMCACLIGWKPCQVTVRCSAFPHQCTNKIKHNILCWSKRFCLAVITEDNCASSYQQWNGNVTLTIWTSPAEPEVLVQPVRKIWSKWHFRFSSGKHLVRRGLNWIKETFPLYFYSLVKSDRNAVRFQFSTTSLQHRFAFIQIYHVTRVSIYKTSILYVLN